MGAIRYNRTKHRKMSNYFLLLIFFSGLLFFPIFMPLFHGFADLVFQISATIVIAWGAYVVSQNGIELALCSVLAVLAIAGYWVDNQVFEAGHRVIVFRTITGCVYFFNLARLIVLQLLEDDSQVNLNMVYGAIILYFIVGVVGGELCVLMDILNPGTFFVNEETIVAYNYYYFSFVTLTTVGYGDFTPNNESGRALALLISLIGQIYLTITMAIIIGKYLALNEPGKSE